MTDTIAAFGSSLDGLDVGWTQVTADEFEAALEDAAERPAIGARLTGVDASLPEWVTIDPSGTELTAARTGITEAAFGIADYGSVVLRTSTDGSEPASLFPEHHVAVLSAEDVLPDMGAAFERFEPMLADDRDSAIIATGPSATADMGKLVRGAHGPKSVHVVVVGGDEQ